MERVRRIGPIRRFSVLLEWMLRGRFSSLINLNEYIVLVVERWIVWIMLVGPYL